MRVLDPKNDHSNLRIGMKEILNSTKPKIKGREILMQSKQDEWFLY